MTDDGRVRLYRFGPLPAEAAKLHRILPRWLREYAERSGMKVASGRWFTSDRAVAERYRDIHPASVLRYVDVSRAEAAAWSVESNPKLLRYATDPEFDYFIPAEVADRAVRVENCG